MQTTQTQTTERLAAIGIEPVKRRFRLTHAQQRKLWGFLFALPAISLFALFSIYPIGRTFYLSFFDYSVVETPRYVGLDNFRDIVGDARFNDSLLNSFRYVVFTYIPVWVLALLLAMALNTRIKGRGFFRTIYFVPVVMSWVVVSVIWKLIFHRNGLVNTMFLDPLGQAPRNWLTDVDLAPQAIVMMSIWKEVGFFMVVFLAGLQNIPSDYYEAARVDGSTGLQLFRYITLPLLQPTILFCSVIGLITGLQVFIPQFVMTQGGPVDATLVLTLDIYQTAFVFLDGGKA
ncbi:MAG: multiple sugar transport system permease protein, partial [Thermomicrobiales bacterium]|nr:multiple sugar transport system permease protein [Thermomicrobiales bacterium]